MSFFKFPTIGQVKKKRNYDTAQLGLAYKAVETGKMSVYKAARVYCVPESTLRDRHLRLQPVDHLPSPGPAPLFTLEEEKNLIDHMTYMSNIGYSYSRQAFLDMALEYAVILGNKSTTDPTLKGSWYQGFKKRWSNIHLAKPEKLAIVRARATSQQAIDKHFVELKQTFKKLNLDVHPDRIWNIDESGILMEHTPPKVLCPKGATPQAVTSPRGKNVTLIGCGKAAGRCIPPYFIFPGKRWSDDLLKNTCPGAAGEMSETGWSNSATFKNYLANHFLRHVNIDEGQIHLIVFDGHKSHVSLTLTNWGKEHGLEFYILPPHTSHVTQPLDVACFGPLKAMYNTECQTYMRKNPGQTVNRYVVAELSSNAYLKAFSPSNIVSAFRKTGIYPIQRDQIHEIKTMPSNIYVENGASVEILSEKSDSQSNTQKAEEFLSSRKIVAASAAKKKRFVPPPIVGNLSSNKNTKILEAKAKVTTKSVFKTTKSLFNLPTKILLVQTQSPSPCCSKENIPPPNDSDFSLLSSSDDEEDVCCVCNKRNPPTMNLTYVTEFVNWAQCDHCQHWTHLTHCSKVRAVRRGAQFLCPHCDQ